MITLPADAPRAGYFFILPPLVARFPSAFLLLGFPRSVLDTKFRIGVLEGSCTARLDSAQRASVDEYG